MMFPDLFEKLRRKVQMLLEEGACKEMMKHQKMLNAVLYKLSGNWIHGGCAKIKRVTNRHAIYFKCKKCKGYHQNIEDQKERLHDDVETVKEFSYQGDRINSGC